MSLSALPESVRQSELAQALEEKLLSQQPVAFDYWGEFKRLCEMVSAQTGEMKILFPEFTPHDEANHLARLFGIADKLLGSQRYKQMNAAELFLLACGLYAHDWGMAVGHEELDFIRSWATGKVNAEVFTPLDDEAQVLRQFMESQGIRATDSADLPTISDEQLRLYIRRTHAWRSGVRAGAFFKTAGSSIPQALEKVCQGHWLNFSELDDERRFSSQTGVLGHTVNLRAVALYVRLVDLFDIADDRTPYAIWRFVAPLDGVSKMEWEKHRALSPVTFPEHGDGRCVRFDGSTPDPEVWAELEDLRHYCEEQISGTMDLMARHQDDRHQLDIRRLDWKVTAERFKPVDIRFEFHRQSMFEILADEIYQGDSYVFLREMLQNSIDAIRMRRELVQRRTASSGRRSDVGLGFDDAIYFDVQHGNNGDAIVSCRDYGIGMDEYIVRNYLSVAGVSYYQSDEFKHLGLTMDPISRFGIGILSCFMVADRIEITTCREPQVAVKPEPLHIDVPAVNRQFRVYPANGYTDFGTDVTVHVLGKKLKGDVREKQPNDTPDEGSKLQVTEYLREIAGFVEFPIVIDEEGQRTIILHPDRPQSDADEFRIDGITHVVNQLSKEYAWDKEFVPQDAQTAQQHLRQHSFDLKSDLGLIDYEGILTYIRPVSEDAKIGKDYDDIGSYDTITLSINEHSSVTLRKERTYGYLWMKKEGLAPSSQTNHALSIYRDGLLVADAVASNRDARLHIIGFGWPTPALRVNLPKNLSGTLDVARRALLGADASWDAPIWQAVVNYLRNHDIAEALDHEPITRIYRLSKLAHIFNLTEKEIVDLVPNAHWPVLVLSPDQGAVILDNQLELGEIVRIVPEYLNEGIRVALGWENYNRATSQENVLTKWSGEVSIASITYISGNPLVEFWTSLSQSHLNKMFAPIGIRFLKPPYPGLPPLPQYEFKIIAPSEVREGDLFERMMLDPLSLEINDLCALRCIWRHYPTRHLMEAAPFHPPFEKFFIGLNGVLNLHHPMTIALLRCAAAVRWHQLKKTRSPADIGKTGDQLRLIAENSGDRNLQPRLDELWGMMKQSEFLDLENPPPALNDSDYIPVSATSKWMERALEPMSAQERGELEKLTEKYLRPFGQPLDEVLIEEAPDEIIEIMSKREEPAR